VDTPPVDHEAIKAELAAAKEQKKEKKRARKQVEE